jgi:hypothetical protein
MMRGALIVGGCVMVALVIAAYTAKAVVTALVEPELRGTAEIEQPARQRIVTGERRNLTIGSRLERLTSIGSLVPQAGGTKYDAVTPNVTAVDVTPLGIAHVRPGARLELIGLTPGIATVVIRGDVNGRASEVAFEVRVVEAGSP